jgi:hypothetical protein
MPDLLAHALIAFAVCTALAWRYPWITPAYVTVGMAGAFIPDLANARMIVPDGLVTWLLGVPSDWSGIHTTGGAILGIAIGVVLVIDRERRRVGALLAIGAGTHLLADALLLKPSGRSFAVFWPLTRWHPPTPGVYLSTDPWPTAAAALVAGCVWWVVRRRGGTRVDRGA